MDLAGTSLLSNRVSANPAHRGVHVSTLARAEPERASSNSQIEPQKGTNAAHKRHKNQPESLAFSTESCPADESSFVPFAALFVPFVANSIALES